MKDDDELTDKLNKRKSAVDQHKADQSAGRYENLMNKAYLHPDSAEKKMNDYRAKHGDDALHEKLSENSRKTAFGRRPGSMLSADGYKPGADNRRNDSYIARQSLPDAVRDHNADKERADASKRAVELGQQRSGGPAASPQSGPSFSEKLHQQREAQAQDPEAKREQKERDLERMRLSREQDKERGR